MASIAERELFSWNDIEGSGDLDRLRMVLEAIPDEALMVKMEKARKGRRDDYPIRAVWNSVLAGVVFQHKSVESLRRELLRNGQLRAVCGFSVLKGDLAVPWAYVYSRFLASLFRYQDVIDEMFDALVERVKELLPDFGTRLGIDSKALETYAASRRSGEDSSDPDADWGVKTYRGQREDGTQWEKVKSWFGYKLHLIVDTDYEIPVAYDVTRASVNDTPRLLPMMEALDEKHGDLVERSEYLSGDKAYDSTDNNRVLWDLYGIKPIIDIRQDWKEEPDLPRAVDPDRADTIFYRESGEVVCRHRNTKGEKDNYAPMAFEGFEKDRECLKFRCPAAAFGIECTQRDFCNGGHHPERGRIVRIPLDRDRRVFVPQARNSYTWSREYKKRTAVERVNSRLDVSFGFEEHFIRGLRKMRFRVGLALIVMLSMAVGFLEAGEEQKMRSLVKRRAA
jgi:hypothetical protein